MTPWLAIPMGLQALAMLLDELYFHRQRGLPRWERIGHPIDTLSVLVCYGLALTLPPLERNARWLVLAAAISCLLVTKDEWVHSKHCAPREQWLHAVLFMLHPIVLGAAGYLWLTQERELLWLSAGLTATFAAYQASYWNVPWKKLFPSRSTTLSTTSSASAGTPPMTTPSPSYAPNHGSETRG